jgi:hypothetical protein
MALGLLPHGCQPSNDFSLPLKGFASSVDFGEKVRREKQAIIRERLVKSVPPRSPLTFLGRFTKPDHGPLNSNKPRHDLLLTYLSYPLDQNLVRATENWVRC